MELVENTPLDVRKIAELITDKEDMFLVWPAAKWPFDPDQWAEKLDPAKGNFDFFVYDAGALAGHAALLNKGEPDSLMVSFLYIVPTLRSKGLGGKMIGLLADFARARGVKRLNLGVRDYNLRGLACYRRCGFREYERDGTLIRMEKDL